MSLSRKEVFTDGAAGALRSAAAAPRGGIVDFAAMIAAAEAEVVKTRADQLAASDRLAREEAVLSKGLATVSLKPKLLLNDAVRRARDVERLAATSSTPQDDKAILAAGGLLPEVVAHDEYLGRCGATGGWHPQDAADFERAVAAARGNYSHAIRIVCDLLPLLGEDEVRTHACWHRDLAHLSAGKKAALERWRESRQAEKDAAAAASLSAEVLEEARAQKAAERQQRAHRRSTRDSLRQWKIEKEAKSAAEEAAAEAAQHAARKRDQRRRTEEQTQRRASLQPYLAEKKAASAGQAQKEAEAVAAKAAPVDPVAAARVKWRQQAASSRQQAAMSAAAVELERRKERSDAIKQQAAAAVAVGAPRDPQRLTQPTKSTASRVEARRTTGTIARDSGYVRHISRRTASLSGSR